MNESHPRNCCLKLPPQSSRAPGRNQVPAKGSYHFPKSGAAITGRNCFGRTYTTHKATSSAQWCVKSPWKTQREQRVQRASPRLGWAPGYPPWPCSAFPQGILCSACWHHPHHAAQSILWKFQDSISSPAASPRFPWDMSGHSHCDCRRTWAVLLSQLSQPFPSVETQFRTCSAPRNIVQLPAV